MATGSVSIVQVNNNQGNFNRVERVFLYLGACAKPTQNNKVIPISNDTNLDELLGIPDSELKTQITAARVNSKDIEFACYAVPFDATASNWQDVLYEVLDKPHDLDVEAVVLCTPLSSKKEIEACQVAAVECMVNFAKFITIHAAIIGVNSEQNWSDYLAQINGYLENVAADRVAIVPLLHGNDLGVVMGRLCNPLVTLADSPMRVATGAVVGLGAAPVAADDAPLNAALVRAMSEKRCSVAQWYTGYDGMYWADHMLLDSEGGDFQVFEHKRVLDYLARRVRILAISRIADRRLNSTAKSVAAHQLFFARPLREAAVPVEVAGFEMPGLIKPPEADAIKIIWKSQNEVAISITAQPYKCPKKITMYMGLDLSN